MTPQPGDERVDLLPGELLCDPGIFPRALVFPQNVARYASAMRGGAVFPPLLVDRDSRRIVDGWHRHAAWRQAYGNDAPIPCILRAFPDDASMFLSAVSTNTAHGQSLSTHDEALVVQRCRDEFHLDDDRIRDALHVDPDRLARLGLRVAQGTGGPVVLKRPALHLAGHPITPRQEEANRRSNGQTTIFLITQMLSLIDGDLIDTESIVQLARLRDLRDRIDRYFSEHGITPLA